MDTSNRKVAVFMALGILLAGLIGMVVWKSTSVQAGSQDNAGFTGNVADADTTETSSLASASQASTPPSTQAATSSNESMSGPKPAQPALNPGAAVGSDPLAPPGAVVNPPAPVAPQQHYRPNNVLPEQPSTSPAPQTPKQDENTQPNTQPELTQQPSAPEESVQQNTPADATPTVDSGDQPRQSEPIRP
ncbi:hypothetical protein [Corynebacterium aquatimens]|uniref:Uncharacterized protein n=1 Tax=Corynebacterium aquatimens TaxID=1190508 RepID=A0A931DZ84_9CORY|nr:hypothetical protein [Corynebacterium aquatimens]MBG6123152.1 hypothetical protein [Corynebacterium aquatimens]WJY66517.1 hypothetical protein CAQUA_09150 [Corynebacterium aquatimens]